MVNNIETLITLLVTFAGDMYNADLHQNLI